MPTVDTTDGVAVFALRAFHHVLSLALLRNGGGTDTIRVSSTETVADCVRVLAETLSGSGIRVGSEAVRAGEQARITRKALEAKNSREGSK